jgi:methylated-DNA-[protein]-cysteine S-methyltransferase
MEYRYTAYKSPFGELYVLAGDKGIVGVSLGESFQIFRRRHDTIAPGAWKQVKPETDMTLRSAVAALRAYFTRGEPFPDAIPLDPRGTPFRRKVWTELRKIPHGKTMSYSDVARRIGSPRASRAVGSACGINPIPLFIPCHRVVAANGGLGGFGGGLKMKESLIAIEAAKR